MTPASRLLAGSVGKTFGAALLLQLAQEGTLHLDDRVDRWLGSETWFKRLPNASTTTIRELLNHTSGVPDHVFTASFGWAMLERWATGRGAVAFTPLDLIAFVLDRDPLAPAGSEFMLYLPERRLSVAIQMNSDCGVLDNREKDYAFAIARAITKSLRRAAPASREEAAAEAVQPDRIGTRQRLEFPRRSVRVGE